MIANTELHEPKSSQEVFQTCLRPCFLRDNARAKSSMVSTPHKVWNWYFRCISARQCVYLLHHRLRLCLGVGG